MEEVERKKYKAFVYTLRYDELATRLAMRTAPPEEVLTQIEDLAKKVEEELAKKQRIPVFDYFILRKKLPRLAAIARVQLAEKQL